MRESKFQSDLICDLADMFPGCIVMKNDTAYRQGFPDISIFYGPYWAVLECKVSWDEPYQPNQEYYLAVLNEMSFAAMICPENREDVLHELQRSFTPRRSTRISQRKQASLG